MSSSAPSIVIVFMWVSCDSVVPSTLLGKFRRTVLRRSVRSPTNHGCFIWSYRIADKLACVCTLASHNTSFKVLPPSALKSSYATRTWISIRFRWSNFNRFADYRLNALPHFRHKIRKPCSHYWDIKFLIQLDIWNYQLIACFLASWSCNLIICYGKLQVMVY